MEFLDPRYQKHHLIRLIIGYILVGTALFLATTILVYHALGFGVKDGEVIQNGLIFVSSRPEEADVYVNGQKRNERTNARLLMEAGQYSFEIRRDGYRTWKRAINVEGGSVVRFDYPALFPSKLITSDVHTYDAQPALATASPDRRWLMVQSPAALATFDVYDMNNPEQAAEQVLIPDATIKLRDGLHRWKVAEWSNDNRRVLLRHTTEIDGKLAAEYILLDRETPSESVNLSETLGENPDEISLRDKKFDQYYLYNKAKRTVMTASLDNPTPKPYLEAVLGFKSHGDNVMLYATNKGASNGSALIKLREGDSTYTIRQVDAADRYMLDLARYDGAWYVAAGSPAENRTYVYKNPAQRLVDKPKDPLVPVQVLKAGGATNVSFSSNTRFIAVQGGQQIAVYDAETDRGYSYKLDAAIEAPQENMMWMDGHRLMTVVEGKVRVLDFDNANKQTLSAASSAYQPFFDRDYEFMYTLAPETVKAQDGTTSTRFVLRSTALLTPADQ
jgi:hypothetical protein